MEAIAIAEYFTSDRFQETTKILEKLENQKIKRLSTILRSIKNKLRDLDVNSVTPIYIRVC
ncbi:MAG: hypothetical protein F6J93_31345 [Oscillatoria sp. SIO1A7]|nr:hypothetical protein [Oscillatoria sp. SIO1A7]